MISRMARAAMAVALAASALAWAPTPGSAETTGAGCDFKIGINTNAPADDGIEFYGGQAVWLYGFGYPPTSRVELHHISDGFPDEAFFWEHVREDGTWEMVLSFGTDPELPPQDVLWTAHAEDDPSCTDSVATHFLGNVPVFDDIAQSMFWQEILWLYDAGVVAGCEPALYCPTKYLTRGEMATLLVRALELPATETDFFTDDDGHKYEWSINRLAAAGVTFGCGEGTFCPNTHLRRDEMASFLVRALDLPPTDTDYFDDDELSTHEANINALREAGLTTGCYSDFPLSFCPWRSVNRGEMAAFLYRILNQ